MGNFKIKACELGMIGTDCYLAYNEERKAAVVVDPADDSGYLIQLCNDMGLIVEAILLTHGHGDHMLAAEALRGHFHCPVYAGQDEAGVLQDPELNLSGMFSAGGIRLAADRLVRDQEELRLIGHTWKVVATPGHTVGSVCYYVESEGVLFAGDTLFCESVGRSDFPTGSSQQLFRSIREKLLVLPGNTKVYPGHGGPTDIAHEKLCNPFVV